RRARRRAKRKKAQANRSRPRSRTRSPRRREPLPRVCALEIGALDEKAVREAGFVAHQPEAALEPSARPSSIPRRPPLRPGPPFCRYYFSALHLVVGFLCLPAARRWPPQL